ncbi:ABC transporter substrate-binding protein [Halomicrobium mukohataei]|uniref:ABC transporter substrate-binding protein n=1 Tax=Halomicrobium mukohataei TaxID=57705 RepID=A0A847TR35_9EURY|nr:ABC transporter substrate-binding protein [Halomicrobium mukohataei]NLV08502.1 ABC transporter substrate-binding protein [Halomicrobium mukohataei]
MQSDDPLGRRDFLRTAGAGAVTVTLAGCAGDDGETPTEDGGGQMETDDTATTAEDDGGGGDAAGDQTLVYARGDHPENYDPQQTTSGEVAKVTNQIFDTLIQFAAGSGGELEAGLATDYSLEGTTATLTLREDVNFHSGEPFTAADFAATFRRFTDPDYDYYLGDANRSGYGPFTLGDWIESVDASQETELTIELSQRYAPFLRNLAMFAAAVLSKAQIESFDANPDAQVALGTEPIGTGPFAFDQLDNPNDRVRLTANEEFWGPGPNVGSVVFKTITENSTRVQDVINGASHITDNLDSDGFQRADSSDTATLLRKNGINVGYMAMNMERMEPFRDRRVRRAISLAVNTEAIVNQIYQGFATQASQPLPPDVMGHDDSLDPYPTDKDEAQSLLEEAGYGEGFEFELATFSNPRGYNPSPVQTANQVRSDLQEIGLSVEINQFSDFGPYLDYTDQGRHDACFLGWYTDNADPDNFLYVLLDPKVDLEQVPDGQDWVSFDTEGYSPLNVSAWANTEYMQLVREAQATYDTDERESMYREANRLAHDEAPWVFVDYAETLRAINEAVVEDTYTVSSVGGPYLNTVELQ